MLADVIAKLHRNLSSHSHKLRLIFALISVHTVTQQCLEIRAKLSRTMLRILCQSSLNNLGIPAFLSLEQRDICPLNVAEKASVNAWPCDYIYGRNKGFKQLLFHTRNTLSLSRSYSTSLHSLPA